MKKFTKFLLLGIILSLAVILRFYQLGSVPLSPDWDEAALGYNAYSILQTGHDEYGKFMPFVLQSFDDHKPALYLYAIVPFIPLFGLNLLSVRLPSAILGVLMVLVTYFLVKELFTNHERNQEKNKNFPEILALVASFLLAISPWHIQFSRVAFETNIGLAFNIFGIFFFLKGLKRPWLLFLAALFFGLNLSVYQSDRLFTPLLGLLLVIIFGKQLLKLSKRYLIGALLIGLIAAMPFVSYLVTNSNALSRFKGVSVFSEQTQIKLDTQKKFLDDKQQGNMIGILFHNKWISNAREMFAGYLSHYDFNWLFIRGDLPRHHAPAMGQLYLWELPFFLIGIYGLCFFVYPRKTKLLLFIWFLIAPLPASITTDVPHSVRTLNFLPTFQIFIAIGLLTVFFFIQKHFRSNIFHKLIRISLYSIFFIMFAFNSIYYLNQYFIQQNYFYAKDWQYGYRDLVSFIKEKEGSVDKIIVSDVSPLDQSYIFFLFYQQYNPTLYQQLARIHGETYSRAFAKYEFRPIHWEKDKELHNVLLIGTQKDFPQTIQPIKTILYPDKSIAIQVTKR